jgi:hypothetical protein
MRGTIGRYLRVIDCIAVGVAAICIADMVIGPRNIA